MATQNINRSKNELNVANEDKIRKIIGNGEQGFEQLCWEHSGFEHVVEYFNLTDKIVGRNILLKLNELQNKKEFKKNLFLI